MTTRAGEGEKFVNYSLGGKGACDEVVSFPKDGGGKGNKTLVSAHSGYAVELVGVVDGTEKNLVKKEAELQYAADFCRNTLAEMGKEREALEAKLQELTTQAGDGEKSSEALQKVQADLAELEKQEKEFSTGLKTAETNLEDVQQTLHKERVRNFREGERNMMREKETREAIEFVDGAGLAVLGVDNVQKFFDAVSEKYGLSENDKIDPAQRAISDEHKHLIIRVFSRLVGSSDGEAGMFDPTTHALRDGIGDAAVKNALQQNGLYNSAEFPAVKMGAVGEWIWPKQYN